MCLTATAQEAHMFGFKGGVTFSNFTDDAEGDALTDFHVGFSAGEFRLANHLMLEVEAFYNREGSVDPEDEDLKIKLDNIHIPLTFKYYATQGFWLGAGPFVDINIGATIEGNGEEVDVKDDFKSSTYGAGLGVGYEFGDFLIQAKYNLGMSDVFESNGAFGEFDSKKNSFMLSIGYRLIKSY